MSLSIYQEAQTITANDGTSFIHGDTEMVVNFTNKTDSGLDLTFRYDIEQLESTDGGKLNN